MQTSKDNNGNLFYSDFFTSGFRAMVNRAHRRPFSVCSAPPASPRAAARSGIRTMVSAPRKRPASMIVPLTITPSASSRKSRRSSTASLARFIDRIAPNSLDLFPTKAAHSRNKGSISVESVDHLEVWITEGGPFTPSSGRWLNEQTRPLSPIDPFASSPDSKSFFIDFSESPSPVTPKRESFLSFSDSSPESNASFLSFLGYERPTSIQTVPLPSRRSSFHYRHTSRDKYDSTWVLEEEPSPMTVEDSETSDDPANVDWRQFHSDLMKDD